MARPAGSKNKNFHRFSDKEKEYLINNHKARLWIEIRRCILAGEYRKEKDFDNYHRLMSEIAQRAKDIYHSIFFKFVAIDTSYGGRGVSILTRLFLTPKIKTS